jgi:uncharacterized protein (TIGR02099 family)
MTTARRKAWKWILGLGGVLVLLLLVTAVLVGMAIDRVPEYRSQLQSEISQRTGLAIEFGRIEARWRLYGPELILERPVIRTRDSDLMLLNAKRARLGLDLWESLRAWKLRTGRFGLDSPVLDFVRTSDGRLQLVNQVVARDPSRPLSLDFLPSGHLRIKNATVTFRDLGTGRGPWRVSKVNVDVYRKADSVELEGEATLPPALGRSLRFDASLQGSLATPETLLSSFVLQSADLDLGGVAELLPNAWPAPEEGRGIVKVSGALRGAELVRLQGRTALRDVTLQLPSWSTPLPGPDPLVIRDRGEVPRPVALPPPEGLRILSFDRVALGFHAVRHVGGWQAALDKVELTRAGVSRPQTWAKVRWTGGPNDTVIAQASSGEWQLGDIWPLLAYMPESESAAKVLALRASGKVRSLDLRFARGPSRPAEYRLQGKFADLNVFPVASWPGIKGLSGEVAANERGGTLRTKSPNFVLDWPRLFRVPIPAATEGTFAWRQAADGWHLSGNDVLLRNADFGLSAKLEFGFGTPEIPPTIDLNAQLTDANVGQVYKYLPVGTMAGKVVEWLDRAMVAGKMSAPVRFQGPLRAFPFRNNEGLFLATLNIQDVTLNYDPKWSIAKQMRGTIEFRNESMTANVKGNLAGFNVERVECRFADLRDAVLTIRGTASNDLDYTLAYVRNSPAGASLGPNFTALRGHGNNTAKVDIVLPIKNISQWTMDVQAELHDTVLELRPDVTPIVGLSGTLGVRQYGVETADLRGQWLGGPVQVRADGSAPGVRAAQLDARGRAEAGALATLLRLPRAVALSGAADWHLATRLPVADDRQSKRTFNIDADLQRLAIGLPEPLRKTAGEREAAQVSLEFSEDRLQIQGELGKVRAIAAVARDEQGWRFQRGTVRADAIAPSLRERPGLSIEGRLEELALDQWLNLRAPEGGGTAVAAVAAPAPAPGTRVQDILKAADLDIDKFSFYGYVWNGMSGTLRATQAGWDVSVTSTNATGKMVIPYDVTGSTPLTATFGKLALPAREAPSNSTGAVTGPSSSPDPRDFPVIVASASDFSLGERRLGEVTLNMTRIPEGLRIDTLTTRGESFSGEGQGSWTITPAAGHRTAIDMKLTSTDVRATLDALGTGGFLDAKRGLLRGHLEWPGSVDENFLGRSTGSLSVELESGQLLNVAPGAGRLLGLLNVTALRRRLSLDFSDLTDKGLSFDTVAGDFKLDNGDAYTDNLLLRGPAAEIGIAGRTGLGAKDYDQTAIVTGKVGSALPVAGAVVSPAIGAALFLFSQIFKKPLNGVARGYYRISGTWENPTVERLSGAAIKEVEAASKK